MGFPASLFNGAAQQTLYARVTPSPEQVEFLQTQWNELADHLKHELPQQHGYAVSTWLQGSYKYATLIKPVHKGERYDVDLGVYFEWDPRDQDIEPTPRQLRDWVQRELQAYQAKTKTLIEVVEPPKDRCSRAVYEQQFHIDTPTYHLDRRRDRRRLAHLEQGWEDRDPKPLYKWFKDVADGEERDQMRRLIRYLKAWAAVGFRDAPDARPSSLMLSVLVAESYCAFMRQLGRLWEREEDDDALRTVVRDVHERLLRDPAVPNPVDAEENLNRIHANQWHVCLSRWQALREAAEASALDGQQRLTALNIGLRGSMAIKEPNKWRTNPNAFPKRVLHIDLMAARGDDDEGEAYRFRFLEPQKAAADSDTLWYPVPDILTIPNVAKLSQWLYGKMSGRGITADSDVFNRASDTLHQLYQVVQVVPNLTFYTERSQELDRVLRIFIRMNSGGTVLSYSDLLLSIAVAQWSKLDARQEIHGLVDDINRIGAGFNLSKDFVLKAGLMLADIASVGFKVENFNRANMSTLEKVWADVRRATILTVELAASFGLAEQTLRADSALLPIAYYIFKRNPPENWLGHPSYAAERETIRSWLVRSLLKSSGIWGSGLDTLLTALRDVIQVDHSSFPGEALEKVMAARGKSLSFGPEEVDDLLDMEYGDRRLFPLLSILFPFIDVRQLHHIDHFFPKSQLQRRKLEKAGCSPTYAEECLAARDRLANLQLLEGLLNVSKNDSLPGPWMEATYPDPAQRQAVLDRHDLGSAPATHQEFMPFYNARRERLRGRLSSLLGRSE